MFKFDAIGKEVSGAGATLQRSLCLLNTRKFQMPFNWDFGIDQQAPDLEQEVREALDKYLPEVKVPNLEISGSTLKVYLDTTSVSIQL